VQRTRGERFVASARPDPEHSPRTCDETGTMYSLNIWIVNIFEGSLVVNKADTLASITAATNARVSPD
jgi:hypothetical protein